MTFEVRNGGFSYKAGLSVLSSVSFSVGKGEELAILGPNGAGKTTLLRCMLGFLPWSEGGSFLDGRPVASIPHAELWKTIGYVPQARNFSISATVLDVVLLGRSSRLGFFEVPGEEDVSIALDCLDRLGIAALKDKRTDEISGGELQLVLVAKALAGKPELLVLDEPESNLDFRNQLNVLSVMDRLASDGYSCIFNTHYPAHALRCGTHALLLEKGGGSFFGASSSVITERNLEKAFGVRTAIREIETETKCLEDVLPVEVIEEGMERNAWETSDDASRLAVVSLILNDTKDVEKVNDILHEVSSSIVGRMGMPVRSRGLSIITLIVDARKGTIAGLVGRLSRIGGISIKATYAEEKG